MTSLALPNQRILVTGATGFVGSHLLARLRSAGATVFGESTILDVLDHPALLALIKKQAITSCVHLAGLTTVESGLNKPSQTLQTNIQGTINVLECARAARLERVIIASSVHAYGLGPTPYLETSPLLPTRPYETSKACADLIAQSYAATFNLPVLIPRFVNTYGPGDQHTQRLIPKTISSLLQGNSPTLWGGSIKRDYLFIDDAVEAYIKLLQVDPGSLGQNRAINIGTGQLTSVQAVMRIIAQCLDVPFQVTKITPDRPGENLSPEVSCAKALNVLGWTAAIALEDGLRRTVKWYARQDKVRARALSKIRSQV